ncbi:MAG: glycine cleavage system protein T, partial [Thermoplasmatales archaeon]
MLIKSPLYSLHKKLGARFTEFAGFEMPIQYTSIKDEHLNVRR